MKELQLKLKLHTSDESEDVYDAKVLGTYESKHLPTETIRLRLPPSVTRVTSGGKTAAQQLMLKITYG